MVRHGDTASFKKWTASAPPATPGLLAADHLRQQKNTFIVATTLVCRNAIRGGMDVRDAFALSDSYIQKCELITDADAVTNLQYCMVLDYTERVERIRLGKRPTKLAIDVTNYVLHHLSEPIKTEDIARALYLSRSRLSTKFKEETGETLTDYILKEKSIEAKRLLRYTNKTIISISEYLGFSSPGHFSRVFRKYIGLTPNEYREHKFG
ncbi:MAG: AraC family transcriptional regulator, partial [Parasporobacterium sp.]|nr:AraC family transcriptional regulator [Parasporobacterium sp.]